MLPKHLLRVYYDHANEAYKQQTINYIPSTV